MDNFEHTWPYKGSKLISNKDLKPFLKRNNVDGIIHLSLHIFLIICSGFFIYFLKGSFYQFLAMIIHGIFIAFLYALFLGSSFIIGMCQAGTAWFFVILKFILASA